MIQSSSATSAMVVGFVNSGMMKLSQAIGIVLGANIGTSVTGWILCLSYISSSDALSLLSSATITAIAAIAGILLRMLGKTSQKRHTGDILLGFAVLMYGMNAMSGAVSPLRESEGFLRLMTMFENPILGVLIGTLITAVLQSNSASVGILQALSVTGTISFATAFPMIMGMGIGAAVPVLVSAIGANRDGRRTALIYLFTGIFGTVIFSALFYGVNAFSPFPFMETALGPVGIAMVNSLFRIGSILILFPFLRQLEALTGKLIPEKTSEKYNELTAGIERLEERFLVHPALAIEQCRLTINAMAMDESGAVTDLFGGREDLSRRVIRCVGEPETRFREDALRMLRAYRFAAQLGFSLDAQTQAAIRRCALLCASLSRERVREEAEKTLLSDRPEYFGRMLAEGLLGACIRAENADFSGLSALPKTPEARWTAAKLCCPALDPALFRLPAKFCRLVDLTAQTWREDRTGAEWKRLIAEHGWETARLQASLQRTDAVRQIETRGDCVTLRQLAVTGADFPTLCGRDVGRMLHLLLVYALDHPEQNTKPQLLAAAPSLWQEENKIQG